MPLTTYDELLTRVRLLIEQSARPPVVAIAGHGGVGKSTLASRLAGDLGVGDEQVIGTDGLYARTDTTGPRCGTSTTGPSCSTC